MANKIEQLAKAAIFVDAENHSDLQVSALMQRMRHLDIVERHAYADWRNRRLDPLSQSLVHEGFEMHHTWSGHQPGTQKNTADGYMARGIVQVLARCVGIEVVVIISGDAFFARVVRQLQQQGKQVIVAADPFRVSKELYSVTDEYLAIGELDQWVRGLDHLERTSRYLTFRFVTQKLKIGSSDLAEMIRKGLVIQEKVQRPQQGTKREIRLNRQAHVVEAILGITACGSSGLTGMVA